MPIKAVTTPTTTGELREALAGCLERILRGELGGNDAEVKTIMGISRKANAKMAADIKKAKSGAPVVDQKPVK